MADAKFEIDYKIKVLLSYSPIRVRLKEIISGDRNQNFSPTNKKALPSSGESLFSIRRFFK